MYMYVRETKSKDKEELVNLLTVSGGVAELLALLLPPVDILLSLLSSGDRLSPLTSMDRPASSDSERW